jgi:PleD family two-component response regulator
MNVLPPTHDPYRNFAAGSLDNRPIVLLVHGSPTVRHALFVTLDLDGFDVRAMGDPAEAVLWLADDKPHAMIAELSIEGAGKGHLLHQLRSDAATNDIPLILVSRASAASPAGEASLSGVHHVVLDDGIDRLLDVVHKTVDWPCGQM